MTIDVIYTKEKLRQLGKKMQKCMTVDREKMTLFLIKGAVRAQARAASSLQQKAG